MNLLTRTKQQRKQANRKAGTGMKVRKLLNRLEKYDLGKGQRYPQQAHL